MEYMTNLCPKMRERYYLHAWDNTCAISRCAAVRDKIRDVILGGWRPLFGGYDSLQVVVKI
jgi:hypothetical protein